MKANKPPRLSILARRTVTQYVGDEYVEEERVSYESFPRSTAKALLAVAGIRAHHRAGKPCPASLLDSSLQAMLPSTANAPVVSGRWFQMLQRLDEKAGLAIEKSEIWADYLAAEEAEEMEKIKRLANN